MLKDFSNSHKKVGEGLKNTSTCEECLPVDTDYVELSWDGLEEAKETINSIGGLISSSCIPTLSSAGLLRGEKFVEISLSF